MAVNYRFMALSFIILLSSILLFLNLDDLSEKVYYWVNLRGNEGLVYQELAIGMLLFIVITVLFSINGNKDYFRLWLIKAFVTFVIMIPYESVYGLDAYLYYADAVFYNDDRRIWGSSGTDDIKIMNHIFTYLVGDSYYSLKLFSSFLGFIGLIYLYKSFLYVMKMSGNHIDNKYYINIFFMFPSIIFWSSILGKDPLNLFFVGVFIHSSLQLMDRINIVYICLIAFSILGVYYIRSWWAVILVITLFLYNVKLNSPKHLLGLLFMSPFAIAGLGAFLSKQGITSFQGIFEKMSDTSENLAYGGSSVGVTPVTGMTSYLLLFIPNLFTSLFRPMPFDVRNFFTLLAAIENVILLYFSVKYIFLEWKRIFNNRYLRFLIFFILAWALFYVIISPTNLGMATRFKLQVLPIMLMIIFVARTMKLQKTTVASHS
jgi:hypothetical protein